MRWLSPDYQLPPQGTKVLCFTDGDVWVAQRFREYWFPIPYCDSKIATSDAPELWRPIDFPPGYKGKMIFTIDGESYDADGVDIHHPEGYTGFIQVMLSSLPKKSDSPKS